MSERVCESCGEPMFFNHNMSSSRGGDWTHTHGYGSEACDRAAEVREAMPALYDMAIQSLVETSEALGRFVAQSEASEWDDPATLQRLLLDAYHLSSEGVRTEARWREFRALSESR